MTLSPTQPNPNFELEIDRPALARQTLTLAFETLDLELLNEALRLGASPHWAVMSGPSSQSRPVRAFLAAAMSSGPQSLPFFERLIAAAAPPHSEPSKFNDLLSALLFHCCAEGVGAANEKLACLFSYGANPLSIMGSGRALAHYVCFRDREHEASAEILRSLAAAGALMDEKDMDDLRPMDLAIQYGNLPAIEALWSMGARPDEQEWARRSEAGAMEAEHWPAARGLFIALRERKALADTMLQGPSQRKNGL